MASSTARQKLHAERKRNGLYVRRALVHEIRIEAVLRATGFLTSNDPTPKELDEALSRWIFAVMTRQESKLWPAL